jgi:Xaa-Pro aminopeptidase
MKQFTNDFLSRVKKIRTILQEKNIDSILITSPDNLTYLSGFTYLSPTEREAYILITKKSAYIFTSALYAEEMNTKDFSLILLSAQNPLTTAIAAILKKESLTTLGFEEDDVRFAEYERLAKKEIPLVPVHLFALRVEKDSDEIAAIEEACTIGDKTFDYILSKIKPGMSEEDIALEMELFIRRQHAILSFPSIVAFGEGAAVPHHQTGKRILQQNEFVLLDFGVKVDGYCSDMSRTIFFGKPTDKQKHIYETVRIAQEKAIEYIQANKQAQAAEADKIARDYITQQGYPSFPHSLGHGIGLEVHESPSLSPYAKDQLIQGMVFSVEPGVYITGKAGVRIEDLMVIESTGARLLTKSSRELISL